MTTPSPIQTRALSCELTIDTRALETRADGDTRVPVAISSEAPVMRYDYATGARYLEVLDHAPDAVNLAWAQRGIPLLLSHDARDQYGLVTDLTIGEDRKLRGWIKFSRGQKAQEIRQDIEDGIRPMVSVGYSTGDEYDTARDGDTEVRRYRNWTVFEVSTVPIPADPSVGIGRSHSASDAGPPQPAEQARSVPMETATVPTAPAAPAAVAPPPATAGETMSREATIYAFAASAGLTARDAQALVESGRDAESIGKEMLERMNKEHNHQFVPKPAVELTEREQKQFSLMRALDAVVSGKRSFEMEVSDEFAKQTGRSYTNDKSFFLPLNLRTQLSIVAGAAKGPELRGTELRPELIDLLRQRSLVLGTLGARFLPGLVGNVAFPRQTAATTATWVAEAPGADMNLSSLSLDQVTLSPKTLQASTTVSRQLLAQSTPAADQIVFDDIIAQHAVAIDAAAFWGPGTNAPTGVGVAAGTNLVAMGAAGAIPNLAKTIEMFRALEVANASTDNVAWVTTPEIKYAMGTIARIASTDSVTLWNLDTNRVYGAPAYATNNIPKNLVKGGSGAVCHGAILGDFSEVMIGEWGAGAEIIVDPFTLARRNLMQITSIQFVDVQVRRPAMFAVNRDLLVP